MSGNWRSGAADGSRRGRGKHTLAAWAVGQQEARHSPFRSAAPACPYGSEGAPQSASGYRRSSRFRCMYSKTYSLLYSENGRFYFINGHDKWSSFATQDDKRLTCASHCPAAPAQLYSYLYSETSSLCSTAAGSSALEIRGRFASSWLERTIVGDWCGEDRASESAGAAVSIYPFNLDGPRVPQAQRLLEDERGIADDGSLKHAVSVFMPPTPAGSGLDMPRASTHMIPILPLVVMSPCCRLVVVSGGGSRGVGLGIARQVLAQDTAAEVVVIGRRDPPARPSTAFARGQACRLVTPNP